MRYDRDIAPPLSLTELIRGMKVGDSMLIEGKTLTQINSAVQGVRFHNGKRRYRSWPDGPGKRRLWRLDDRND